MIHATLNPVSLASQLVGLNTAGGREDSALGLIVPLLQEAGLDVRLHPWRPGRPNLTALWKGGGELVLCGHVDTVAFEADSWSVDPLAGLISEGRLWGRGSTDMKGGVAAMVCAAADAARANAPGFTLVLTAAEETGSQGAMSLRGQGVLPADPILIVGEPTANQLVFGHKGAVWFEVTARGRAAHASRPDLGTNAITMLADAIIALRDMPAQCSELLGRSTVSVGMIRGGLQPNLVPDVATMTVDLRTVTAAFPDDAVAVVERQTGAGSVSTILDLPAVVTDDRSQLSQTIAACVERVTGSPTAPAAAAPFFTDASVLAGKPRPRAYIIGPGDPVQPHTVDESCSVVAIEQAHEIYLELISEVSAIR